MRSMRQGKLWAMLREVKTAPGRWSKLLPRLQALVVHLSVLALAAGYLAGRRRWAEEEGEAVLVTVG
jgi:hypothetical protein